VSGLDNIQIGAFGKLPAHGDFIQRNLSNSFISGWDEWMQHYIAGTREQMGEDWLDIYLTSPIWRFVFSPGVVDDKAWAGIMMPSVDRVGRYYPFSLVASLPANLSPVEFIATQTKWLARTEEITIEALDAEATVDELIEQIELLDLAVESEYQNTGMPLNNNSFQINMAFTEQPVSSVFPQLLDSILLKAFNSYSTWTTLGSERVEPCLFSVQGLPDVSGLAAMMDGHWEHWAWQQPYIMNDLLQDVIPEQEVIPEY